MMKNHLFAWKSPVGELLLASREEQLIMADWRYRQARAQIDKRLQLTDLILEEEPDAVISESISQLSAYFEGSLRDFDLPIAFIGSDFQCSVWQALRNIPYGKTMSYLDLSKQLGQADAIRAVAAANGANAISIIVPCHRVVGSDGQLTGYAGGLRAKERLLNLENPGWGIQQSLF